MNSSNIEDVLLSLYDVGTCYSKDEKHQYCHYENGENKLLIPKTNYTRRQSKRYVEYLTHDLLLNTVFQTKFMDNIQIIIDDNVSYSMTKSEIILIESLIKEYFSTLKQKKSSYIDHSVFEDMMPHEIFDEMEHAIFDDDIDFVEYDDEEENTQIESKTESESEKEQVNRQNVNSKHHESNGEQVSQLNTIEEGDGENNQNEDIMDVANSLIDADEPQSNDKHESQETGNISDEGEKSEHVVIAKIIKK